MCHRRNLDDDGLRLLRAGAADPAGVPPGARQGGRGRNRNGCRAQRAPEGTQTSTAWLGPAPCPCRQLRSPPLLVAVRGLLAASAPVIAASAACSTPETAGTAAPARLDCWAARVACVRASAGSIFGRAAIRSSISWAGGNRVQPGMVPAEVHLPPSGLERPLAQLVEAVEQVLHEAHAAPVAVSVALPVVDPR